jgi:hypothetical protein
MAERFGIQDHDQGIGSTREQNPTNAGSFQNISGGGGEGLSWGTQGGFTGGWVPDSNARGYEGPYVPRGKNLLIATILALVFGPFGLAYTTLRGAGLMIVAIGLAGAAAGRAGDAFVWPIGVIASVAWTICAARMRNAFRKKQLEKAREYLASQKS